MDKYMAKAFTLYSADDPINDVIPICQRHFTQEDVNSLIKFYSTPPASTCLRCSQSS
ncbi:MAG TPA: DUF2059 domain-containing protein [Terracidiphilus sp.]|nr:DUF2059 domain-containing protein [Terracidiphilus sp.]